MAKYVDPSTLPPSTLRLLEAVDAELPEGQNRAILKTNARGGQYNDFLSRSMTPRQDLITYVRRWFGASGNALIRRIEADEFDATYEEAQVWAATDAGQRAFERFGKIIKSGN